VNWFVFCLVLLSAAHLWGFLRLLCWIDRRFGSDAAARAGGLYAVLWIALMAGVFVK
jgi:hypothetical protein